MTQPDYSRFWAAIGDDALAQWQDRTAEEADQLTATS